MTRNFRKVWLGLTSLTLCHPRAGRRPEDPGSRARKRQWPGKGRERMFFESGMTAVLVSGKLDPLSGVC